MRNCCTCAPAGCCCTWLGIGAIGLVNLGAIGPENSGGIGEGRLTGGNERRSVEMVEVIAMASAPKGKAAGSDAASLGSCFQSISYQLQGYLAHKKTPTPL